jgi:hypothetical protein
MQILSLQNPDYNFYNDDVDALLKLTFYLADNDIVDITTAYSKKITKQSVSITFFVA